MDRFDLIGTDGRLFDGVYERSMGSGSTRYGNKGNDLVGDVFQDASLFYLNRKKCDKINKKERSAYEKRKYISAFAGAIVLSFPACGRS